MKCRGSTSYTGTVCAHSGELRQHVAFLNAWNRSPTQSVLRVRLGRARVELPRNLSVTIWPSHLFGYTERTRQIRCDLFGCWNRMLTLRNGVCNAKISTSRAQLTTSV